MADEPLGEVVDGAEPETPRPQREPPGRDRELIGGERAKIRKYLAELADKIWRGFQDQAERSDAQADYWDCFNCEANGNRFYDGIADIYLPIVRDAVNARATRFGNQLFPQSGRYVEVIADDGSEPQSLVGLLEHYLRDRRFETQVLKPLLRNGDVEGQYNLYVDWAEVGRQLVSRETHAPTDPETGAEMPGEPIEDIVIEDVLIGTPVYEVLHDCDVLVLPATVDSIEEALSVGGSVTIVRKWTKTKVDQMVAAGNVRRREASDLKEEMSSGSAKADNPDLEKELAEHVGIKARGGHAVIWETWHMLPLDAEGSYDEDGTPRLCRIFFGPRRVPLGAKRNPYWNDRCPLLSCPVEKQAGVFKGGSLIAPIASIQYEANDAINEGADAATLSAAPIVTRDPEKYNGPLVYNVGAVWDIPPDAVKLLTFPDLTPRAQTRVQMALAAVFQSLGVNPSMLPQQMSTAKPTQAKIAQEQAVDLLTTAETVKVVAEGILTPAMALTVDLDYQFRDRDLVIRQFGEMGIRAKLEAVPPLQNRAQYDFVWRGGEQVKMNAMMQQQGTAWLNVLRDPAVRQAMAQEGYQLHLAPAILANTQNIFGAFLGSNIVIDERHLLTVDAELENDLLVEGHDLRVHPLDDDPAHLKVHQIAYRQTGDPHGTIRAHIALHTQSMQTKNQAAMMKAQAQTGGGAAPQQGAGLPQPGGQVAGPRQIKRAPGAIHPDQLPRAGVVAMPRRF